MGQGRNSYSTKEIVISFIPFLITPLLWEYFDRFVPRERCIELFCSLEALAIIYVAYKRIKAKYELESTIIRFSLFLISLLFIADIKFPTWDYVRYENAAKAVCLGIDPYKFEPNYFYLPFFAQVLCLVASFLRRIGLSDFVSWQTVAYFYRAIQFYLFVYIHYELIRLYSLWQPDVKRRELTPQLTATPNR